MSSSSSIYDNILQHLSADSPWTAQHDRAILEPYTYLTSNPGKDMRSKLIQAFNLWLSVPKDKVEVINRVVGMLHGASLMVDDIQDDSQLRRGKPVTHKIYGVPQTINSANYVYFLAVQELFALRNSVTSKGGEKDIDAIVNAELLSLHRGQGLELLWRDGLQCPTEEEYIGMVNNKTGGLLRIGIKLMMACSPASTTPVDYTPLVNLIGVYFQIRDDLMNLQSPEYSSNKGFAEDLTEGKFSFPMIHSIRADPNNRQLLNILQKRTTDPELKRYAIAYMRDTTKSFEYTLGVMERLDGAVRREIRKLGGNEGLERLMDGFRVDREQLFGKSEEVGEGK